jgi:hypothetical protein
MLIGNPAAPARSGIEALLASAITGTWTAFEAMAGDLWETALNIHPAGLAELKGIRNKKLRRDETGPIEKADTKSIPLWLVVKHKFSVADKMGSILRERQRFDHLNGIREAYRLAFFRNFYQVDAALDDAAIDSLASVRHLIVHRAGNVDSSYERQATYLNIPCAPIGQPIAFDGEIVARLRSGALASSLRLLVAVDEWITAER